MVAVVSKEPGPRRLCNQASLRMMAWIFCLGAVEAGKTLENVLELQHWHQREREQSISRRLLARHIRSLPTFPASKTSRHSSGVCYGKLYIEH